MLFQLVRRAAVAVAVSVAHFHFEASALSQCDGRWIAGDPIAGVIGSALCAIAWDPDGPGPQAEMLVVGGYLNAAGDRKVDGLAAWDGTKWIGFGSTLDGAVHELVVYRNELIAVGSFYVDGAVRGLAKWDGVEWRAFAGSAAGGSAALPHVYAAAVHNDELVVGGSFSSVGGVNASNIAKWNGTSWKPLASGVSSAVISLMSHEGTLYVGGAFRKAGNLDCKYVARWNGTSWSAMGNNLTSNVNDITIHNGEVIVCGSFFKCVARWDGTTWSTLGTGVNDWVNGVASWNGALYAAGRFQSAGGVEASRIACWNGVEWRPVGDGVDNIADGFAEYNSSLVVVGAFGAAGVERASNVAILDGERLSGLGNSNGGRSLTRVVAMKHWEGKLLAVGERSATDDGRVFNASVWDGTRWEPLGTSTSQMFTSLAIHDGVPFAAGVKNEVSSSVFGIAKWDGAAWQWLPGVMDRVPYAVHSSSEGLVIGGFFRTMDGEPMDAVARWNGHAWEQIGEGLGSSSIVYDLIDFEGELIAAGNLKLHGREDRVHVAKWTGSAWEPLGSGVLGGVVYGLAVHDGMLIAGGTIQSADGEPASRVAAWDGKTWRPLGSGMQGPDNLFVRSFATFEGRLVASGRFTTADGKAATNMAAWNGTTWEPMGTGKVSQEIETMTVYGGELVVGGAIVAMDNVVSQGFGRWTQAGRMWVAKQPETFLALCRGSGSLSVGAAAGYYSVSYRWRRDGVELEDETGVIEGTSSDTLKFVRATASASGSYDCVVSNECGNVVSNSAIVVACAADVDCSGKVDAVDVAAFLASFDAGDNAADADGSGFVDTDDFDTFVRAFEAGC